jgi:hypothetical protein
MQNLRPPRATVRDADEVDAVMSDTKPRLAAMVLKLREGLELEKILQAETVDACCGPTGPEWRERRDSNPRPSA